MDLAELQKRNYAATVRRGLICKNTDHVEFDKKLFEEALEVVHTGNLEELQEELSDVIIVCLTYAKHYNLDIQSALEQKTIYNENRKD